MHSSRPHQRASVALSSSRWRLPCAAGCCVTIWARNSSDKNGSIPKPAFYGLFQIFRGQIFHELTLKEFADAFAQMLAYGLFLARLNSDTAAVTLHNARQYVPGSFRLIRELVDF